MNKLLMIAVLAAGIEFDVYPNGNKAAASSYQIEDFHYYDENMNSRGLNMAPKLYVDIASEEEKKKFVKQLTIIEGIEKFKQISTDNLELDGLLLFFKSKQHAFNALTALKGQPVYPVVIYEGIEVVAVNEIIVKVQPNVSKEDLLSRLQDETKAEYQIIPKSGQGTYLIKVSNLQYPSNIIVLANMMAQDTFWFKRAMVNWSPLDGFIKASLSVETPSRTNLGELRYLKLVIDVFDPEIKVRKDMLPQLGATLIPFPSPGEMWLDAYPQELTEVKKGNKTTITLIQPFRELQFGSFVFQPVVVSYEHGAALRTVKSNVCGFDTRSVIEFTDIEDIQPRAFNLSLTVPDKMVYLPFELDNVFMNSLKYPVMFLLGGLTALFLTIGGISFVEQMQGSKLPNRNNLWTELEDCIGTGADWQAQYRSMSSKLNEVLATFFNTSLYKLDVNKCDNNFKALVNELNKLYMENAVPDISVAQSSLREFCLSRKYD